MPEILPDHSHSQAQLQRIYEATDCKTQNELAAVLGIRQSSVSLVLKRKNIPDNWLVRLFLLGVNPQWILTGDGPRYLPDLSEWEGDKPGKRFLSDRTTIRSLLHCFDLEDLTTELQRRKRLLDNDPIQN